MPPKYPVKINVVEPLTQMESFVAEAVPAIEQPVAIKLLVGERVFSRNAAVAKIKLNTNFFIADKIYF